MSLLNQYISAVNKKSEAFLESQNWRYKSTLLCCFVVVLSFFNNLSPLKSFSEMYKSVVVDDKEYFLYQTVKDRAGNMFGNFDYEPYSGKESRTFRLVAPLFVRVLGISNITVVLYSLQLVCGFLFLYLLSGFLHQLLENKTLVFYALLGFSGIYAGSCFFIDNAGYGDLFSFFFLFLSIYFRKYPVLVFGFLQLAFWNDERAFVGSGLVFVWLWWYPQYLANADRFKVKFNWSLVAVVLAWAAWYAGRTYLMDVVGMKPTYNPDGEFMVRIKQSVDSLGFRLLWQFEGWWLLFILMVAFLYSKRQYLPLFAISVAALASMLSAMIIYDSTRSGNFAFISIFFALAVAKRELTEKQLKLILLAIALICFLHPLANKTHGVGFFLM